MSDPITKLRASGAFVSPSEMKPVPEVLPPRSVEIHGHPVVIDDAVDAYFWPHVAWLQLRPFDLQIAYVSMLEHIQRDEGLFFGLESYLVWRAGAGAVLLGWVERRNAADALAEIAHLQLMRSRLFERLGRVGCNPRDVELGLVIASPSLSAGDLVEHPAVDEVEWVGPAELGELGVRLDEAVEAGRPPVLAIEQLIAATGALLDHEFPSQALTPFPRRCFPGLSRASRAA